jgi:hypothetical protein
MCLCINRRPHSGSRCRWHGCCDAEVLAYADDVHPLDTLVHHHTQEVGAGQAALAHSIADTGERADLERRHGFHRRADVNDVGDGRGACRWRWWWQHKIL